MSWQRLLEFSHDIKQKALGINCKVTFYKNYSVSDVTHLGRHRIPRETSLFSICCTLKLKHGHSQLHKLVTKHNYLRSHLVENLFVWKFLQ